MEVERPDQEPHTDPLPARPIRPDPGSPETPGGSMEPAPPEEPTRADAT